MKVCFFGIYDKEYSRNRVLMQGLIENDCKVTECHIDSRSVKGIHKYVKLFQNGWAIRNNSFDLILVGFPGHMSVWVARLLFPQKEIVFDAFLSLYDSNVHDRKVYGKHSIRALRDWLLDWYACALANHVLLDTNQYIEYFIKTFRISKNKFVRVPISADTAIFFPKTTPNERNRKVVHFHGMFIPLQGIEIIVGAAALSRNEPWVFEIQGGGQTFTRIQKQVEFQKLTNVKLLGKVSITEVTQSIAASDVCLGIFGTTAKAQRVIPNKVYESIAMEKPVITADTPAIREFFTDGQNIVLIKTADSESLYIALKRVLSDVSLAEQIAHGGRKLFETTFTPRAVVARMLESLT